MVDPNGDIRGLTISQGSDKLFSFAEAKDKNDVGLAISFEDDFSGWSFSDDETETEGSWVENEDGWFEWVPAA